MPILQLFESAHSQANIALKVIYSNCSPLIRFMRDWVRYCSIGIILSLDPSKDELAFLLHKTINICTSPDDIPLKAFHKNLQNMLSVDIFSTFCISQDA